HLVVRAADERSDVLCLRADCGAANRKRRTPTERASNHRPHCRRSRLCTRFVCGETKTTRAVSRETGSWTGTEGDDRCPGTLRGLRAARGTRTFCFWQSSILPALNI